MLYVRVELWPHGDSSRRMLLAEARIANDGTGTHTRGNYNAAFFGGAAPTNDEHIDERQPPWRRSRFCGFSRATRGAWDLLYCLLHKAVGLCNKNAVKA